MSLASAEYDKNKNGNQDCSCRSTIGVKTAWNSQRLCWMVLVFNQTQYCWMFSWFREKKTFISSVAFCSSEIFLFFFLEYLCMLLSVCFEQASEGKDYKSLLWLYFSLCIFICLVTLKWRLEELEAISVSNSTYLTANCIVECPWYDVKEWVVWACIVRKLNETWLQINQCIIITHLVMHLCYTILTNLLVWFNCENKTEGNVNVSHKNAVINILMNKNFNYILGIDGTFS